MTCEARKDLITQLVLGRLELREVEELRAHLETGCATCTEWLSDTQQVALALSSSPDPVEPSADAKRKLRERLAAKAAPAEPLRRASSRRDRPTYPLSLVAGLSAIAAGTVVAVFFGLRSEPNAAERDDLRAQLVELRSELELSYDEIMEVEARARVLEADAHNSARQIEMLRSPHLVVMSMVGTSRQPRARARAFWSEDYYCYLRAENIRSLSEGRTYVLWLDTENQGVIMAGTFVSDATGTATLWVPLEDDLGRVARAFVTEEAADEIGQEPTGPVELQSPAEA